MTVADHRALFTVSVYAWSWNKIQVTESNSWGTHARRFYLEKVSKAQNQTVSIVNSYWDSTSILMWDAKQNLERVGVGWDIQDTNSSCFSDAKEMQLPDYKSAWVVVYYIEQFKTQKWDQPKNSIMASGNWKPRGPVLAVYGDILLTLCRVLMALFCDRLMVGDVEHVAWISHII